MGNGNRGLGTTGVFTDSMLVTDSVVVSEAYVRDSLERGHSEHGDGDVITGVKYGMLMGIVLWAAIVSGLMALFG